MRTVDVDKLGNCLTVLLGFSELLNDGAYGPIDPRQKKTVRLIFKNAQAACDAFRDVAPLLRSLPERSKTKE